MKTFVLTAAAVVLTAGAASAAPVFFDDFESYTQGAAASIAPTWQVLEGSVDVIGTPGAYPWYPGQQIDMNGSGGESTAAAIGTIISGFIVGRTYQLSFDYGSNKNSNEAEQLMYQVADYNGPTTLLFGSVSTNGPVPNLLHSGKLSFVATAATLALSFADGQFGLPYDDDNSQGGPILDNVLVSPVPLPAAGVMLLAGLGGLAGLRRRKIT